MAGICLHLRGVLWAACAVVVLLLGGGWSVHAQSAPVPTADQMEIFRNLTPEQQKAVLDQLGGPRGEVTTPGLAPTAPTLQAKSETADMGPPTFRAGDQLLLAVTINAAETWAGAIDTSQALTRVPPGTDDRRKAREEYRARLMDGNPYSLDRMGRLVLPGIQPVVLAGLTPKEATGRLNAEPQLDGYSFTVTLLPVSPELRPFGYDLFSNVPTTFAPASDIPVPAEYVVGPGDTLELQLIGDGGGTYALTVGRDGTINVPQLGPIAVAGMRYPAAKAMLEKRVGEQMLGMRANVSMGPLRSIQVFVLGEAVRPGSYTVSGLSTITNALFASGGVKRIGSLRNLQLKRSGKVAARLDLYDLLLNGDTGDDVRLLPGDVIFIPPIGPTVAVSGEVQRPAIYEVRGGDTAADALYLSGGLTPTADPHLATLERVDAARGRIVVDVDLSAASGRTTRLRAGDTMKVPGVRDSLEGAVTLEGHVYRAGSVQYRPGMKLTDLVGRPDELKPLADTHYVLIRRESGPTRVVSVQSADLAAAFSQPESSANVPLQARDTVYVFDLANSRDRVLAPVIADLGRQSGIGTPLQVVGIGGRVKVAGQYPLEPGMHVSDLLRAGGGLSDAAYAGEAELTRYEVVNGERRQIDVISLDLAQITAGNAAADLALRPFDYLVIKEMPLWRDQETIVLEGEVRFPGTYPVKRGESMRSVIARAGGLTDMAFAYGSVFTRRELREREAQQMRTLGERLQRELTLVAVRESQEGGKDNASGQALAAGQALLADLKSAKPVGRLTIQLDKVIQAAPGSPDDVLVRGGDELVVPRITQEVTVLGEVQGPTSHLYQPNLTRDDYIARSGGFTQSADKSRVYVIRANGEVVSVESTGWLSKGGANKIKTGDTIIVPINAEKMRPLTVWTSVTQILYNIAVAVAAVNSF